MPFDRASMAVANEKKYPFIVEVPVAANGLDVELNGQIVGFHKSYRNPPRLGRTFSDLETARAYVEQFGGGSTKQLALDLRGPLRWGAADLVAQGRRSSTGGR